MFAVVTTLSSRELVAIAVGIGLVVFVVVGLLLTRPAARAGQSARRVAEQQPAQCTCDCHAAGTQ